jgi:EmrB/QacA subfamily drug resistance transporter
MTTQPTRPPSAPQAAQTAQAASSVKTKLDPVVVRMALVLVLGAIAPLLDSTIVNVALHTLGRAFSVSVADVQWVATGYLLSLAIAIPLTGWVADRIGAKRVWIFAQLLFLLGSVLCGLSWNLGSLIGFRVLQGFGGGLMLPVLQTLLLRAVGSSRETLGRLMAVVTIPALVAPIFGPVVGGLIIGHASWRWIFYVNVPICLLGAFLAWRMLPADAPNRSTRLDITGLLLLSPALAALLYGLASVGIDGGFAHVTVIAPLAIGVVLTAAFLLWARHRRTHEPLLDLSLFRISSFSASSALLFISGLSMYGSMLLLPLYYQQERGESVIVAGLMMAPQGIGSLLARGGGALTDRFGPRPVLLGSILLTTIGTIPFVFTAHNVSPVVLGIALAIRGAGLSGANMAVMVGAYRDLSREQIPHASTATRIAQQIGASFGTAVLAVVLTRQLAAHPGATGLATAYGHTFLWSLGFTVASFIPALFNPALALPRISRGVSR